MWASYFYKFIPGCNHNKVQLGDGVDNFAAVLRTNKQILFIYKDVCNRS